MAAPAAVARRRARGRPRPRPGEPAARVGVRLLAGWGGVDPCSLSSTTWSWASCGTEAWTRTWTPGDPRHLGLAARRHRRAHPDSPRVRASAGCAICLSSHASPGGAGSAPLALAGRLRGSAVSVDDAWAEVTCERAVSGMEPCSVSRPRGRPARPRRGTRHGLRGHLGRLARPSRGPRRPRNRSTSTRTRCAIGCRSARDRRPRPHRPRDAPATRLELRALGH